MKTTKAATALFSLIFSIGPFIGVLAEDEVKAASSQEKLIALGIWGSKEDGIPVKHHEEGFSPTKKDPIKSNLVNTGADDKDVPIHTISDLVKEIDLVGEEVEGIAVAASDVVGDGIQGRTDGLKGERNGEGLSLSKLPSEKNLAEDNSNNFIHGKVLDDMAKELSGDDIAPPGLRGSVGCVGQYHACRGFGKGNCCGGQCHTFGIPGAGTCQGWHPPGKGEWCAGFSNGNCADGQGPCCYIPLWSPDGTIIIPVPPGLGVCVGGGKCW